MQGSYQGRHITATTLVVLAQEANCSTTSGVVDGYCKASTEEYSGVRSASSRARAALSRTDLLTPFVSDSSRIHRLVL
jgi:hypothetical protein